MRFLVPFLLMVGGVFGAIWVALDVIETRLFEDTPLFALALLVAAIGMVEMRNEYRDSRGHT